MTTTDLAVQSKLWQNNSVLKEKRQSVKKQNYMPFLFRSKRKFIDFQQGTPPVGAYDLPTNFKTIRTENQPKQVKALLERQALMSIFRSSQSRFTDKQNQMPGPASFNYKKSEQSAEFSKLFPRNPISKELKRKFKLINRNSSCPSIPDTKVKKGNYRLIEKSQKQLQNQKLKLKKYCQTLVEEIQFRKRNQKNKDNHISQILKRQQQTCAHIQNLIQMKTAQTSQNTQTKRSPNSNKRKISHSNEVDFIHQKNGHLGPGCYDYSLDTIKKQRKNQNFQFFNSSSFRFTTVTKDSVMNANERSLKDNKRFEFKTKLQFCLYKKSFPIRRIDPYFLQKTKLPGPGYYDPEIQNIKKSYRNVKFGYEARFKQDISEEKEENNSDNLICQNQVFGGQKKINCGSLRKNRPKNPHVEYQPIQQSDIYGIMNEEQSRVKINPERIRKNIGKNKESAFFKDKSCRLQILNRSYNIKRIKVIEQKKINFWEKKGTFISKSPKKHEILKQNTPGPGTYNQLRLTKKSFNINKI